jgi:hypothetical protein
MHIVLEVQNAIHALSHKTRVGCGGENALFAYRYQKIKVQRYIEYEIL